MCAAIRATARPLSGRCRSRSSRRRASSGSAMIAWRPTSWKAMFCAECRAVVAIASTRSDALGEVRGQAQRLHPAHRAADHRVQPLDPERVEQRDLRADHVADGDDRESACAQGLPVAALRSPARSSPCSRRSRWRRSRGSGRCRSACPGRPSRSHQPGLPVIGCGLATCWSPVSAWKIEDRVGLVGRQLAVSLVGESHVSSDWPLSSGSGIGEHEALRVKARGGGHDRQRIGGWRRCCQLRREPLCAPP